MEHDISVDKSTWVLAPKCRQSEGGALSDPLGRAVLPFAAVAGISASVFPIVVPWALLPLLVAIASVGGAIFFLRRSYGLLPIVGLVMLAALGGVISLPLATALASIAALSIAATAGARRLAYVILALQFSYVATIEALISGELAIWRLESGAPPLLACTAVLCVNRSHWKIVLCGAIVTVVVAWIARVMGLPPPAIQAMAAVPVLAVGAITVMRNAQRSAGAGVVLCSILACTWVLTLPNVRSASDVHLILPRAPEAPEARHFSGIEEGLRFAGLRVTVPAELEQIPKGAFVLLPWLSSELADDEGAFGLRFRQLANLRHWTVLMFGEHTGMGNLDVRAEMLADQAMFRRDLTVPPGNGDISGPLRSSDMLAWPNAAVLNRGATTRPSNVRSRILLSADGWWADEDLSEWLWLGDYRWRSEDRGGRLSLAHATRGNGGATWIAVGDTSPALTRQLVADPRPFLRLLELATLVPALLLDIMLLFAMVATILSSIKPVTPWRKRAMSLALALAIGCVFTRVSPLARLPESEAWRGLYIGEGGFEASNFNVALAGEIRLLSSGWALKRHASTVQGEVRQPRVPAVSFLLVETSATFASARVSDCWRLGALEATEKGPRLMDAQACRVDGDAEVLVGNREGAAVIRVSTQNGPWIIVLDRGFLAETAPPGNRTWLLQAMGTVHGE